jgi:hypothetical protein
MKYMRDQETGRTPVKTRDDLAQLWLAASRAVQDLNLQLADACHYKALGWINSDQWDRAREQGIRTDLEYITSERLKLIRAANLQADVDATPFEGTTDVVVLVHGIRDYALWQSQIRASLTQAGMVAELTNYGRFDLLRFLVPVQFFRQKAIAEVWEQIQIVKQQYPTARLSIIAHSFGTYVISQLIKNNFNLDAHRIIFCGSVVPYRFRFQDFQKRFMPPILNEVGTGDIWPAMADSVTWGYGSAGTYGFRRPLVHDRWHNKARHGYFLTVEVLSTLLDSVSQGRHNRRCRHQPGASQDLAADDFDI